ncbi:hypothetical protein, partial [Mesorhizobium sp. M8A.F.Ca.ET.161.01.1.1]|uniref:hypothetical protein n=1 Tax=Mesorhizobium sp. M8A.F.Ca.ET.161.01.1.1 TaxID=2563959 RepID=UPI001AED61C7
MSVDLIFANCRRQAGKEYAPLLAPGPAVCWSLSDYVIDFKNFQEMVSTRGFEPPTPGFIPLRLSPPPCLVGKGVRGLDCPFTMGR